MTQNKVIWIPKSVETPFCRSVRKSVAQPSLLRPIPPDLATYSVREASRTHIAIQTLLSYPLVRKASHTAGVSYRMRRRTLHVAASCL